MKKFYLNEDFNNPLSVNISPTLVETLDESLDNMTITLGINEESKPYAPILNKVGVYEVDSNNNRTLINEFIISSDTVELATQNPLRYKHTLSLVQRSQLLTKHLIRNNVFSIPASVEDVFTFAIGGWYFFEEHEGVIQPYGLPRASIDLSKVKIEDLKMEINAHVFKQVGFQKQGGWEYNPDYDKLMYTENNNYSVKLDENVLSWDKLYQNNSIGIKKQKIKFTNNNETREWELDENVLFNQKINIPEDIISWIKTLTGTLQISVDSPFPTDLSGFIVQTFNKNFYVCGTITYNFFNSSISTQKVYDVIEELVNQYKKNTKAYNDDENSAGYDSSIKPLFLMPTEEHNPDLYNLLKTTNTPNFIFTQASMYDALSEIFRLFDATFRIDEDG